MPDYSKGKIYTIRCKSDTTLIYVGSTIQPLAKRWGQHKKDSLIYSNFLIYKTINNDWFNWYIELYELYPCSSREELCKKEGEVIRLIGNLNCKIAGRTDKEYYQDNKEKFKIYYEDNKEKINEAKKKYRVDNKDKIKIEKKEYYENNKEKLSEKHTCSCGGFYTTKHKLCHFKTKKHTEFLTKSEGE